MKGTKELTQADIITIASILKILGHPVRVKIICILERNKKLSVNEILDKLNDPNIDQPTLSHHLIKLKNASIVKSSKSGLHVYYELQSPYLADIIHCFEKM
ncbi:MAG: transcriptional regulator [Bacteroidia bacterium]|nr:MAG: transcriptional regulator [Bacteroidia bacterium]